MKRILHFIGLVDEVDKKKTVADKIKAAIGVSMIAISGTVGVFLGGSWGMAIGTAAACVAIAVWRWFD